MTTGTDSTARSSEATPRTAPCWTFLPLHGKHGKGRYTMLDHKDYERFRDHSWPVSKGYAARFTRTGGRDGPFRKVSLAREILGLEHGDPREADHINRDKLDNRRCNLRIVTRQGNVENCSSQRSSTSRFRGVSRISDPRCWRKPWRAQATHDYVRHYLGDYATEEEAAEAARAFRAERMTHATD